MKKKEKLQKTYMYRLQPGLTIKPKPYHDCPGCQTQMTLTKESDIKSRDLDKIIRALYHYKCPECSMQWAYDSFFRLINS